MYPKIIASYGEYGVNIGKIVQRIIKYAPEDSIRGLNAVRIVDKSPDNRGFACYLKDHGEIYLFVDDIIGWQSWLLKRTIIFFTCSGFKIFLSLPFGSYTFCPSHFPKKY